MIGRQRPGDAKQRPTPEAIEIEGRTLRIADDVAGQQIVETATLFEMANEGEDVAQEPCA